MPLKIPTVQIGLEKSIQKAVRNVSARGGLNLALNDKSFTRPLGKITGSVSEFNKSLEASNARVLAFGASVGMIQGVQSAFKALLQTTIQVEKQLTEINIVMGLTNNQLDDFSKGLFKVAKNTAQSFSTVATAATELARQGLTMEETLKRTNDALILTRLTGLDAANAVSGLTAAINTFNKAGLDSTQILSKMAAVDVQFAVSTEDLIDAVSRAGAVAQDAGVSFDELLGAVTAAQQMTARGGKVIGNSFKTIFTRIQRSSTINRLEELGIAVRDVAGNTLPAIRVLENLSSTYENLADTTKAAVAEQVGGVFQINILKAAINDLSSANSILARATQIAASATDEAYKKNEILNRSLAALASQSATSIKELANIVGDIGFSDQIRDYLTFIKDQVSSISDFLGKKEGESAGADFAKGLIKGIGNVISGPGLLLAAGVLIKLFAKTASFLAGSAKELMGVVSAAEKQKQVQTSIVSILGENSNLQKRILSQEGNRAAQEKTILTLLQAQAREQQRIAASAKAVGPAILRAGFNTNLSRGRTRSKGHVPNYVSQEERFLEKEGARSSGYTAGSIRSMDMKGRGRIIYNTAEKVKKFPGMSEPAILPPRQSKAGRKYKNTFEETHGFNPYANKGMIPNYSKSRSNITFKEMGGGQFGGPPRQVLFKSTVGGEKFTDAQTMEIVDPKNGGKKGLQVIFTGDSPSEMRGKGYGRELYEYMAKYAKRNGYGGLYGDMGTSISAMRVVDSIAKRKSFKVEKNPDLKFIKDDFEEEGIWGSDNWTYRMSNKGLVPNYALSDTPVGVDYLLGLNAANPANYKSSVIAKYETFKDPTKLNELLSSPRRTLDALKYLDNKGLNSVKESMLSTGLLTERDWELVKQGVGKKPEGNVADMLRKTPARDLLNYMVGNTDRISGNTPGAFLRLMDREEREKVALDMIGRTGVSGVVKRELNLLRKSKNRIRDVQSEVISRDIPKLTYNPERGITKARQQGYLLAQMYKSGNFASKNFTGPVPDRFKDQSGNIVDYRKFGDFSDQKKKIKMFQQQREIERSFLHSQNPAMRMAALQGSSQQELGLKSLLSNSVAGRIRRQDATEEFERLISNKDPKERLSPNDAFKKIRGRIPLDQKMRDHFARVRGRYIKRFGFSEGMIPNLALRMRAKDITPLSRRKTSKLETSNYDGIIGMSELDKIIKSGLFKSVRYNPVSGSELVNFHSARYGVHKYKKGAPPPKGYESWNEFDKKSPLGKTRVIHTSEKRDEKDKGYRRLRLDRIQSVVHRGKHYQVDPAMANQGFVPNYMKMKTVAQAVGVFKSDTGKFSAGVRDNFWAISQNKIKLRQSNYDDVRQFINSKSFRSLPEAERNRITEDLRAQSEVLNMNDVTRPYFQYGNPDYEGMIHANKGLIPNYAQLFSGGAKNVLSRNPQFGGAVKDAIAREASFGVTPKVVEAPSLKGQRNPGLAVVNQEQEKGLLSNARKLHGGLNPNTKSSAIPNYAMQPVGLSDVIQAKSGALATVDTLGLSEMEQSFMRASDTIDEFSAATDQGKAYLKQQGLEYARSSDLIKEANLREKARLGTLNKENIARQKYMRQAFRKDALSGLAGQGGAVGDLAKGFLSQNGNFEKNLQFQMAVADKSGDTETLKGLEKLDESLNKSASILANNPQAQADFLEKAIRAQSTASRKSERFGGTKGFSKSEMKKFFATEFLAERNISVSDDKEAMATIQGMGGRGNKAFEDYLQSQGVLSSNKTLARGGLKTGDFRDLTSGENKGVKFSNDGSVFISKLDDFQRKLDAGEKTGKIRKELFREASKIGKDAESAERLQTIVSSTEKTATQDRTEKRNAETRQRAQDRLNSRTGRFNGIRGSFMSGIGGGGLRSQGLLGATANRTGRVINSARAGAKNFMTKGFGAAGGQVGLGLSIMAPMLAGMINLIRLEIGRAHV